jgi:NAD(P)-dependent dehydrogenase (short-subunit alcohol dehydrogenase family)
MGLLRDKVALVTGAGRGLGRCYALALAEAGARIVVNDFGSQLDGLASSEDPAGGVVREIEAKGGCAIANRASVASWSGAESMIRDAVTAFGKIDIVENNAGISRRVALVDMQEADVDLEIGVHLKGALATTHFASAWWHEAGPAQGRAIINTTSAAGLHPNYGGQLYPACKAAIAALTMGTAHELAYLGVRANAIAPCARTRMVGGSAIVSKLMPPKDGFDRHAAEHVAPLVVYLASSKCRFTGRVFAIEGPDVATYTPWSVEKQHSQPGGWTAETLAEAFSGHGEQADHMAFFPGGSVPFRLPSGRTLKELSRARTD